MDIKDIKDTNDMKHCLYCNDRFEGSGLFCSAECKSRHEEEERHKYITNVDKNWK